MQFKGLVRFFAILLIIYSIYQLSFTWFVKSHENKMEARALKFVHANYPDAKKYSKPALLPDSLVAVYDARLKRLLDSTRDVTLTYAITGPVSYQKAKEEELNLGLDLQGGMNVTMEVEMTGLLKTLANNSKDPTFHSALNSAEKRKANSDANFVTLFADEYQKAAGPNKLSSLFFAANDKEVKIGDSDDKIKSFLNTQAIAAFENTLRVLRTRIDQFGVAQPSIYPNPERGTITVELPGIKDKERVRKLLQSSANLQFWETYRYDQIGEALNKVAADFEAVKSGKSIDTATTIVDTTATAATNPLDTTANNDTLLSGQIGKGADTVATASDAINNDKNSFAQLLKPPTMGGTIGMVEVNDTALVREYLNRDLLRRHFPADVRFAYGIVGKSNKKEVPLYALRTYNRDKADVEGEAIQSAIQDYESGKPIVRMEMNAAGALDWAKITKRSSDPRNGFPIAIVLDGIVYSAPVAQGELGNTSQITGDFTVLEAQDLANILKSGKLSAPAKIVQEQEVGPTLGREAIRGGTMAFVISFIVIFVLMLVYYNT